MQRRIDYNDHTDRYFQLGVAVFAFFMTCGLGALVFYVMMSLSAMSLQ